MPEIEASTHAVASGHPLATAAAVEVLEAGGNAVDAGLAAVLVLGVVHSDLVNVAGVAPMILRMAGTERVVTIDGLGTWPAAASARFFEDDCDGEIPEGLLRTVVPAAPAAVVHALARYGTMSFSDVAHAAIRHAREGFEVYELFAASIAANEARYARWAANRAIYLPGGRPPRVGERLVQSDLAGTLQFLADEERASRRDRAGGLSAVREAFYRGDVAETIAAHHRANGGLLTREDLAGYAVREEPSVPVRFLGHEVHACGPWCQGISLAQALAMLDRVADGLADPDAPETIHSVVEILKLVFADRERHVADPAFVDVPVAGLLAPAYLDARLSLIDPARAFPDMPPPGDPASGAARLAASGPAPPAAREGEPGAGVAAGDTSHVCVIDGARNMFAATPSDTSADTEVIPGTGLAPSSRGSQSMGRRDHVNAVAPGKRPRLTPNPALVLKDGAPFMVLGTPGGDVQVQAMAEVLLRRLRVGEALGAAVEAPRYASYSFPSSFAPNDHHPGVLMVEDALEAAAGAALRERGHDARPWGTRTWKAGGVCAVEVGAGGGPLRAAADPRRTGTAGGR